MAEIERRDVVQYRLRCDIGKPGCHIGVWTHDRRRIEMQRRWHVFSVHKKVAKQ